MSDYIIIVGYGVALLGGLLAIAGVGGRRNSERSRFERAVEVR